MAILGKLIFGFICVIILVLIILKGPPGIFAVVIPITLILLVVKAFYELLKNKKAN